MASLTLMSIYTRNIDMTALELGSLNDEFIAGSHYEDEIAPVKCLPLSQRQHEQSWSLSQSPSESARACRGRNSIWSDRTLRGEGKSEKRRGGRKGVTPPAYTDAPDAAFGTKQMRPVSGHPSS